MANGALSPNLNEPPSYVILQANDLGNADSMENKSFAD